MFLGDKIFVRDECYCRSNPILWQSMNGRLTQGRGYSLGFGGTASLDCIVLLPVKLESFGSAYNSIQKVVDIEWSTNKETHIDYYEVQKSYNAVNFESLEEIAVTGNSYASKNYHTVDANPLYDGITYYRLKYWYERWIDD